MITAAGVDKDGVDQGGAWCVVVAAGSGARFGSAKQFATLDGDRVVDLAVATAKQVCDGVVLVAPSNALEQASTTGADLVVAGGDTRSASSLAGVQAVPDSAEFVLVHDAARPLATAALFSTVLDSVLAGCQAVIPVVPVIDSIRDTTGAAVPRENLLAVQTPQGFAAGVLRDALAGAPDATDDAQAVESTGVAVTMVPGEPDNVKITRPADLAFVRAVLALRRSPSRGSADSDAADDDEGGR
ncbi:MAG: 2-C-methyl-D-erythritol 4-phosphate cytidylyltransferase [Microthrixaceae bacterium]